LLFPPDFYLCFTVHDWEALAGRWERGRALLWRSTRPVSERLVERLDPRPGQTVLELAAGVGETGFLAAPRLDPGGLLISSDRAAAMVESARRIAAEAGVANVEFRVFDSERIELGDASVDGVLSRFGYVLLGGALAEIRRVLRPGGTLAFSAWADRGASDWMAVPRAILVERGHLPARQPEPSWDAATVAGLVRAAGFASVEVEEFPVAYRFADADELWLYASELLGPVAQAIAQLDAGERAAVRSELERRVPQLELAGRCLVVTAT
jgi:ubiquinone/menaquinone biosynthesis C-methylase UbiE